MMNIDINNIDISGLEQLVDESQTNCIAVMIGFLKNKVIDEKKIWQVTEYLLIQDFVLAEYKPLPFEIDTRKLVPLILDTIEKLPNELKTSGYYARLIGNIKSIPSFKSYEGEKVEKILKEFKEKYYNPPKVVVLNRL